MVGETLRGRVNGNDLFTVARPLVGPDERLTGVIPVAASVLLSGSLPAQRP